MQSSDADFPEDVVETLRMLEAGTSLPPEEHAQEPEEGAAFVARIDKLIARYEAQFLKKSDQKVCWLCAALLLPIAIANLCENGSRREENVVGW